MISENQQRDPDFDTACQQPEEVLVEIDADIIDRFMALGSDWKERIGAILTEASKALGKDA